MGNDSTIVVGLQYEKSGFRNDSLKRIMCFVVLLLFLAIFLGKRKDKKEDGGKSFDEKT